MHVTQMSISEAHVQVENFITNIKKHLICCRNIVQYSSLVIYPLKANKTFSVTLYCMHGHM